MTAVILIFLAVSVVWMGIMTVMIHRALSKLDREDNIRTPGVTRSTAVSSLDRTRRPPRPTPPPPPPPPGGPMFGPSRLADRVRRAQTPNAEINSDDVTVRRWGDIMRSNSRNPPAEKNNNSSSLNIPGI